MSAEARSTAAVALALDAAGREHVGAVGDLERAVDVLLDEQDGRALVAQPLRAARRSGRRRSARARATARRAAAAAGAPSASGRSRASAAGRPRACRRSARGARSRIGKSSSTWRVGRVVVGAVARDRAAEPQVVGDRQPREHAPALGRERDPAAHDRLGRELAGSARPRTRCCRPRPARGRRRRSAGSTCPRRWRPAGRRSRPAGRSATRSARPRWGRSGRRGRRRRECPRSSSAGLRPWRCTSA